MDENENLNNYGGEQVPQPETESKEKKAEEKSVGGLIGIIIIIIIIILGGLYLWGQKISDTETPTDEVVEALETQETSDEIDSIEKDLNDTELENIDAELETL